MFVDLNAWERNVHNVDENIGHKKRRNHIKTEDEIHY